MKTIPLTQGLEAIVDDEDFERLSRHKWYADHQYKGIWYAVTKIADKSKRSGQRKVYMHRLILDAASKVVDVDHRSGNGLDNRRQNLRTSSRRENLRNQTYKRANCSSKYKGVSWDRRARKWFAYIAVPRTGQVKGRASTKKLGYFEVEEDAAQAYNWAAALYFGEFASFNEKTPGAL